MQNNTFQYKEVTVTKSFTTERKHKPKTTIDISRKGSIVKERCKQLVEILLQLYPEGIVPEEDMVYFIARYIGADRNTIRAYLGFKGSIARNKQATTNTRRVRRHD